MQVLCHDQVEMSHSSEETMSYTSEGSAPGDGRAACEPQVEFRTDVKIFDIRAGGTIIRSGDDTL